MSYETDDAMPELVPVEPPADAAGDYHAMTAERERYVQAMIGWIRLLVDTKFRQGQQEHGGNIWEKPGMLRHAIDETTDQFVYLLTLDQQIRQVARHLRDGRLSPHDAADALDRLLSL